MIKFKKFFAVMLCLLLAVQSLVVFSDSTDQNAQISLVYPEIAVKLGILDAGIMGRLDSNITRGELVSAVVHMRGIEGSYSAVFSDVAPDHLYAKEISCAYEMGYINGLGDGTFRPDEDATYSQALKLLVYLAGYREIVESGISVEAVATDVKISKNFNPVGSQTITVREAAEGLVKVGTDVRILDISSFTDNSTRYSQDDETIFNAYLNIYDVNAVITANEYTGIYEDISLGENMIMLGSEKMTDSTDNAENLLGCNVTAYVSRAKIGRPELLYAYPNDNNETIHIPALKLYDFKNGKIYYEDEKGDDDEIEIKLSSVATIYNGVLTMVPSSSDFDIETGSLELIDNNNDNEIDVVKIEKYENCIIDTYDSTANKLWFKFGSDPIGFDELDDIRFISSDNKQMDIREVVEWDVVSIKRSKKNELVTVIYIAEEVEGEVGALYDKKEKKMEIDGVEYDIADVFMNNLYDEIYIGQYVNFYLDIDGKIASYNTLGYSEKNFYYLIGIASGKGLNIDAKAKLMDDMGNVSIVPLASKVELDTEFKSLNKSSDMQTLVALGPQIIIGKLNDSGALAYIDTAGNPEGSLKLLGTLSDATYKKNTTVFYKSTGTTIEQMAVSDKTVYMYVPLPGKIADDDDYYIQTISGINNNSKFSFSAYTDGEGIVADAIVRTHNPESGPGFPAELAPSVVNKVTAVLNDKGEPCYKISLYNSSANLGTYYTESDSVLQGLVLNGESYFPAKGDIVKISTNRYGEIRGLMPVYCAKTGVLNTGDSAGTDITNIYRRQITYAYKKDDHFVMTTTTKPLPEHLDTTEGLENLELKNLNTYKVVVYDSENDLLTTASSVAVRDFIGTDGAEASKLFVFERYLETGFVCIYR